ncbi:hypothetical protein HDV05_002760, partial [Chytridiales sp. JEL 0842]
MMATSASDLAIAPPAPRPRDPVTLNDFYDATNRLLDIAVKGFHIAEHTAAYAKVLSAASGDRNLKSLATTAIPKYIKHFPNYQDAALDAHLDLCEDDDPKIRKDAVKGLPIFCKDTPKLGSKVADVLCQLLQT